MAAVAGGLLAITLAAVLDGGEPVLAAAEPQTIVSRTITIPAAAFDPTSHAMAYENHGPSLFMVVGDGTFRATFGFEAREIVVREMVLYATDDGPGAICVYLNRSKPADGAGETMGEICTTGHEPGVRTFTLNSANFDYRRLTGAYGPYLRLTMPGTMTDGYLVYDLKITSTYEA